MDFPARRTACHCCFSASVNAIFSLLGGYYGLHRFNGLFPARPIINLASVTTEISSPDRPRAERQQCAACRPWRAAVAPRSAGDRKSVVLGKSVSVRVDLGGRRIIKKKKKK